MEASLQVKIVILLPDLASITAIFKPVLASAKANMHWIVVRCTSVEDIFVSDIAHESSYSSMNVLICVQET